MTDRRRFLRNSGYGGLVFLLDGAEVLLSPAQARERAVPLQVLTHVEAATLEAFGEVLHPGATAAGIAHFVDQQLAAALGDTMLIAKHFVEPPFVPFYQEGLRALNAYSQARHGSAFTTLDKPQATAIVQTLSQQTPAEWSGPPSPLLYLVVRGDAVDVVYAGMDDYARLGIPYMPHIVPPSKW